jgi:hypothetical protein
MDGAKSTKHKNEKQILPFKSFYSNTLSILDVLRLIGRENRVALQGGGDVEKKGLKSKLLWFRNHQGPRLNYPSY